MAERSAVIDFFQKALKKKDKPRQPKPEDLKLVGVQDSGMARTAANAIVDRNKQLEEAAKD